MKAEDVIRFLQDNPSFFEEYAELLAQIYIPHPHGGRAIPIAERQILTLREKSRMLEAKLAELIQFGEENDAIGEKMHRLALALVAAADRPATLQVLYYHLREDFAVPHAALRLWGVEGDPAAIESAPVSDALREYALSLEHPHCGAAANAEVASWFGESASQLRSAACIRLLDADKACIGLLSLASEDAARFYPEMGTLYLSRLGELLSAALARTS